MSTRIGPDLAERIAKAWPDLLDAMAAGDIMAPHYKAAGLKIDQVRVWRLQDQERITAWDAAREQSADVYAERVLEIADNPNADHAIARVRIDALKWLASKRNPKGYSDRVDHNVTVRTVDLTRIIEAANARLAAAQVGRTIEHETQKTLPDLL